MTTSDDGPRRCPRCGSPDPKRHPAVQFEGEVEMCRHEFHDDGGRVMVNASEQALIDAVLEWSGDRHPSDPGDARLMKAIWTYSGPNIEPCPECDGDCGEACAPCSVEAAHASLDQFIADWERKRGVTTPRAA